MALSFQTYIEWLSEVHPEHILRVREVVDPANYDATAVLQHLENAGKVPLVLFERPKNLKGEISEFPLATNMYASRKLCAFALGLPEEQWRLPLSLEYARREAGRLAPERVSRDEAPVKAFVKVGEAADLREFPVVRHHRMDPGPYNDMTIIMRDRDGGFYNGAMLRTMVAGPRKMVLGMGPRHNRQIMRKYWERNERTPLIIVTGHHPAFHLGALNVAAFGDDDYELIGSIMGEPLRLVASETWGDRFMVPADADVVIEGEILPGIEEVEAPFGEFTGYYGPQVPGEVIEIRAITCSRPAVYQDCWVGHRDNWILGAVPKEGSLFNRVRGIVPTVRAVHFPVSGCGRFNCYISIDKRVDGETKQAALVALGACDYVKNVVVVDGDVDPFNEQDVMWAVATRTQADQDVDIIKNCKGNSLDPSQTDPVMTAKLIIDATKPLNRPYEVRIDVPKPALERVSLESLVGGDTVRNLAGNPTDGL